MFKYIFVLALFFVVAACGSAETSDSANEVVENRRLSIEELEQSTTGKVFHSNIEGGFWAIIGDNGGKYDPVNLPDEYKIDGLKIRFKATVQRDMGSIHMWGHIVKIEKIEKL